MLEGIWFWHQNMCGKTHSHKNKTQKTTNWQYSSHEIVQNKSKLNSNADGSTNNYLDYKLSEKATLQLHTCGRSDYLCFTRSLALFSFIE
jgi:hypothetical protein